MNAASESRSRERFAHESKPVPTNWRLAFATAALCAVAGHASAQEFALYVGPLIGEDSHSYGWALDYTEGFGPYFAGSFTWLNEGHISDHHRDGPLVQVWARYPLAQRRLVVAVGMGPYGYFDTQAAEQGAGYSNMHGWGASTVRALPGIHRNAGQRICNSIVCR